MTATETAELYSTYRRIRIVRDAGWKVRLQGESSRGFQYSGLSPEGATILHGAPAIDKRRALKNLLSIIEATEQ